MSRCATSQTPAACYGISQVDMWTLSPCRNSEIFLFGNPNEDEETDEEAAFRGEEKSSDLGRIGKKRSKEIDLYSDEDKEDQDALDDDIIIKYDVEPLDLDNRFVDYGDEEEEDDEKHRRMIEDVTGKSPKAVPDRARRRRKEVVISEAYPESEFNLNPSAASANGNSRITVEDLLTPLHDTTGFGTLRKRLQQLQNRSAPVQAPLPKVIQERLDRRAGYEKTCEDITKWQPIVKRNREAPSLVFNKPEPAPTISTAALAANFKPTTDFEKEVHTLIRESKLADVKDVEETEALELNKLTVVEVRERQERLSKMRNLLFRHEAKAKRLKKIKSKTFHRLLQKSKVDVNAAVAEADPEAAKAAAIKREFNRAQERMTLKHKNSSRWAKRILKRGLKASETDGKRDAIAEQLRAHAALTRKVHSAILSDSDDALSDSEEEMEDVPSGLNLDGNSKVLMKAKVATLKALEDGEEFNIPTKGLFSLPFMTRAIEKRKKIAQNEAMAILEQLEQAEDDTNIFGVERDHSRIPNGNADKVSMSGIISLGGQEQSNVRDEREDLMIDSHDLSDEDGGKECPDREANAVDSSAFISNNTSAFVREDLSRTQDRIEDDKMETMKYPRLKTIHSDGAMQDGRIWSVGVETVPPKQVLVTVAGTGRKVRIDLPLAEEAPSKMKSSGMVLNGAASTHFGNAVVQSTFSDDESDSDVQRVELLDGNSSQQALIRQAFAGDDVEAEFEKAKAEVLDEEVPQGEGPVSLPGWGQWTRVQQKRGQPAWLLKEQESLERQRKAMLSRRKDAKLKHVIISEKQDKKAAKFTAASTPFPFSSREVFERSTRLPIGRDFNTDKAYRDMIRPAVIKSAGVIIEPIKLEKSPVEKKEREAVSVHVAKRKRL